MLSMPPSRGVIAAEDEVDALDERSRGHSVANDSLGALSYAPTSPGTVPPSSGEHREAEDDGSPSAGSPDVSSIGHVKEKAAGWRSVPDLLRDLDGGKTEFDVLIDGDDERPPIKFREPDAEPEPEFDGRLFSNIHMHSPAHLATHLPKVPGCEGCGLAKAAKSPSRRRALRFTDVLPVREPEEEFGALIHADHIEMERASEAARSARYCLNVHDERTSFFRPFPVHKKDTNSVVDALHEFDSCPLVCKDFGRIAPQSFGLLRVAYASRDPLHTTPARPTGRRPMVGLSDSTDWRLKVRALS